MNLVCPECNRKIVSFNFNYCLYCKKEFDESLIKEIEKEKAKDLKSIIEKDLIQWKFQYSLIDKSKKTITILRSMAVIFLIAVGFLLIIGMMKLISFSHLFYSSFSALIYAAFPIIFIMLGLIGYIIYKLFYR